MVKAIYITPSFLRTGVRPLLAQLVSPARLVAAEITR